MKVELTERELHILINIAQGRSNKDVANDLDLSVKTIEAHRYNIYRKIGVHNTAGLVHYAIYKGLIKLKEF